MAEYIEREAVILSIRDDPEINGKNFAMVKRHIESIPTADVVEVVHGEWINEYDTYGKMMCSVCKCEALIEQKPDPYANGLLALFYVTSNYCPNCGAKMDGGNGDG